VCRSKIIRLTTNSWAQERVPSSELERIVGEKVDLRGLLRKV
jgi:hypothetical protein